LSHKYCLQYGKSGGCGARIWRGVGIRDLVPDSVRVQIPEFESTQIFDYIADFNEQKSLLYY